MAEEVETPAAEPAPAEPQPQIEIPSDPKAYAEWRQTGKLPDSKPSKGEDSAPSKAKPSKGEDSATSASVEQSEKGAPVSETGQKKQVRSDSEQRIRQLVSERDSYKARLEALEAGKKDVKTAESSPAPAKRDIAESPPAPEAPKRPVKPKQDEFDSWEKFEAAQDKYLEDLADWKATQKIEEDRQRQRQEAMTRQMQERLDKAKERYGDEAEPKIIETAESIFKAQKVPDAIKTALGRSEVMVDALYVMGSDEKELSTFMDLAQKDPLEALRKWFTVEALVKEELARGAKTETTESPPRGPDGKFLSDAKPAKKFAPAPPTELNGNSSPPGDQTARAADSGNFTAFREEMNRKDLLRHKGQG